MRVVMIGCRFFAGLLSTPARGLRIATIKKLLPTRGETTVAEKKRDFLDDLIEIGRAHV